MRKPLKAPTRPQAMRASMVNSQKLPPEVMPLATIKPAKAIIEPVEMSIPPEEMTSVMPMAMNSGGVA